VTSNPSGICQCGCGDPAPIALVTRTSRGVIRGQHLRFIQGHFRRPPNRTSPDATPLDHAWAAGIVDGEGSIQIRKMRLGHTLGLSIGQSGTDTPPMLLRFRQLYGGRIYIHRVTALRKNGSPRRPHWGWAVTALQAERVLEHVEPYIVEKRDQVALALIYRNSAVGIGKYDRAESLRDDLRAVQKR
jgi:hypothetical protein